MFTGHLYVLYVHVYMYVHIIIVHFTSLHWYEQPLLPQLWGDETYTNKYIIAYRTSTCIVHVYIYIYIHVVYTGTHIVHVLVYM